MVKKGKEKITDLGRKVVDLGLGLGLGLVSVTEKKVRAVVSELIKRGDIKKEEAEGFVDRFLKKTEEDRKGLEERITGVVKKVVEKLPLATKSELNEIKKRLSELEK